MIFRFSASDNVGVAYAIVQDDLTGTIEVKSGSAKVNSVAFADGVYTVNFAENKGSVAVTGSAIKCSLIVNDTGYNVAEGSFAITGKITVNGITRSIVP